MSDFEKILADAKTDPNIIGVFLGGSRGKGLVTEHSDWDVYIIIKEEVKQAYSEKYRQMEKPDLELFVLTLDELLVDAALGKYYFTYIDFPPEVRRMIYTTNSIENLNKHIRKGTKNKLSFESPGRLLDYVFIIIKEFEHKNWSRFPVNQ